MNPIEAELEAAKTKFVAEYNAMSDAFIKMSIATEELLSVIRRIKDHNPTLFDD